MSQGIVSFIHVNLDLDIVNVPHDRAVCIVGGVKFSEIVLEL